MFLEKLLHFVQTGLVPSNGSDLILDRAISVHMGSICRRKPARCCPLFMTTVSD